MSENIPDVSKEEILRALSAINDPDLGRNIVELGFVQKVRFCGGNVAFDIELTTPACPVKDQMKQAAEDIVRALPGVENRRCDDDGANAAGLRSEIGHSRREERHRGRVAAKAASAKAPRRSIWRLRFRKPAPASACWTPIFMARRFRLCWACPKASSRWAKTRRRSAHLSD